MSKTRYTVSMLSMLMMAASCSTGKEKLQVELVAVGVKAKEQPGQLLYVGAPMSVAADYVNAVYNESLNLTLTYEIDDNPLMNALQSQEYTPRLVAEWYYRKRVPQKLTILLIPAATVLSDYMFQQWDILFITVTSTAPAINDRTSNPTWISTARINFPAMTLLFCEVLIKYGWMTFMTVLDVGSGGIYRGFATNTIEDFINLTGRAPLQRQINATSSYDFRRLLQDIRAQTRIVIIFGTGGVIAAHKSNMTNGDYVYMAFETADSPKMFGRMHWKYNDENDMVAKQAFQSLLIMRPQDIYDPPNTDLAKQFMDRTQRDFNYTYDIKDEPYLNMLACYAAVTMVAQVLSELWTNGNEDALQSGTYLAAQFVNRTFGDDIIQIYIDDKGGRQMDVYMWRFDETGTQSKFLYKRAAGSASVVELYKISQWANGTWPPANEPTCGFANTRLSCRTDVPSNSDVVPAVLGVLLIFILALFVGIRYGRSINRKSQENWWNIEQSELHYINKPFPAALSFRSIGDQKSASQTTAPYLLGSFCSGRLKGVDVLVETIETVHERTVLSIITSDRSILRDFNKMRNLVHINISRFYGITVISGKKGGMGVVTEWIGRGCIYDVFDGMADLDSTLMSSLANDFLEGVQFIHSSSFGYHGCLCGPHCHVDKHFTLKISGLISWRLQSAINGLVHAADNITTKRFCFCGRNELDRVDQKQKVDIYAVGVVLREILTKQKHNASVENLAKEDINAVEPGVLQDCQNILELCCSNDLSNRPSIRQLRKKLAAKSDAFSVDQSRTKLIDKIQKRLTDYTRELENEVGLRTKNLLDEIARCNDIVALFLPRWAAHQIRMGNQVQAELFEDASVLFTQICGFGNLLAGNDPKIMIDVLHESEAMVDRLMESFSEELYKVEAVQDCYMAVSGLPVRNGDRHSQVTAELAIKLQQSTPSFFAQFDLQFKSGIHSGPCAAGVVGARRLRYCLFGDTVNTASRMCSNGTPRRIQITQCTASMLKETGLFKIQYRGVISVKGKRDMATYWLHGYSKESI